MRPGKKRTVGTVGSWEPWDRARAFEFFLLFFFVLFGCWFFSGLASFCNEGARWNLSEKKVGFFYEERKLKAKKQNKTAKQKNNKTTKQKQQKKKGKTNQKKWSMVECTVGRRKNRLCVWRSVLAVLADSADRAVRAVKANRELTGVARTAGPVTMHMIDVAERDRGTVCRRVAAYYIAKATALGYAGDQDGARRAFRKFLVFARAERAETAGRADRSEKTERTEKSARTGKALKAQKTERAARTERTGTRV